ncbi:hypothetical protein RHD99_14800 [Buttiauxella selenatireducens]|uniref:Glycosaminoglycan attachment site n=1 Tax=Buttiauxella selenatireducens TaxID=3073902 RepID=A0ABY9S6R5_9ENTR|nr:hypothetical protein [Buttiauxella sp. R73]WMY72740.1 hypothetical protein RHD99_14800 [Buttiauxella sp. R73]
MLNNMKLLEINKEQFEIYSYGRYPYVKTFSEEICWFKFEENEITLLATIVYCKIDKDFNAIFLGRDLNKKFRAIKVMVSFESKDDLISEMNACIPQLLSQHNNGLFMQGDEASETFSIFLSKVPDHKKNIYLKMLLEEPKHYPAYIVMQELAYWFKDPDGIFIRDFQSASFNSRLFELYLNAIFYEMDFEINRSHAQPDYMISKSGIEIAVEAVTIGEMEEPANKLILDEQGFENLQSYVKQQMPFKFARTLLNKVRHRPEPLKLCYWELEHTQDKPFMIAIHDYSRRMSMSFSMPALQSYLYGMDSESGTRIEQHYFESRSIQSNFFGSKKNENVSAILLATNATIPKFDRMGIIAGIEQHNVKTLIRGVKTDDDCTPIPFIADVSDPSYEEPWCTAAYMFHNPNALKPIYPGLFPNVVHVFLEHGELLQYYPPNYILTSTTQVFEFE